MASTGNLTPEQTAQYAYAAGFRGNDLRTIVGIAGAESAFNPRAHNTKPPDNSYGLTQINMIGPLGPSRRKWLGLKSNDELFDPATNMRAAFSVYKAAGRSFSPWSTFNNGTYKKFVGNISENPGLPSDDAPNTDSPVPPQPSGLFGLSGALYSITEVFRKSTISLMVILVAIMLIVLGIIVLNRKNVGTVARVGAKIASKGAI